MLPHAQENYEYSENDYRRIRFYYANNDYEIYGVETNDLIEYLYERFPGDLVYATNGTDFSRAIPSEFGSFCKHFVWVTDNSEMISVNLLRTDRPDTQLLTEVIWEKNALFPVEAIIEKIDSENRIFVNASDDLFQDKGMLQIAWDCGGTQLINPLIDVTEYSVGDNVLLWHKKESYRNYYGSIILIIKMEKNE